MATEADALGLICVGLDGGPAPDPFQIGKGRKKPYPKGHESAEALVKHLEGYARSFYKNADAGAMLRPMVIACCENGDIVPLVNATSFSEAEKQSWTRLCRDLFKLWKVRHYAMISEAWMAESTPDDLDEDGHFKDDTLMPSQRADRKEVIFIAAADRRDRTYGLNLIMDRDFQTGKVVGFRNFIEGEASASQNFSGRFMSLLKESDPADGFDVHPHKNQDLIKTHAALCAMMGSLGMFPDKFGDRYEEFKERGITAASRLQRAFDALGSVPPEKVSRSAEAKEYADAMKVVHSIIKDIIPFMSEQTQTVFQRVMAEADAERAKEAEARASRVGNPHGHS